MLRKFIFVFFSILFIGSCTKGDYQFVSVPEKNTAMEVVFATHFFGSIFNRTHIEFSQAEKEQGWNEAIGQINSSTDPCAEIEYHVDTVNHYIAQLIITYPDSGCISSGKKKAGKLKIYSSGNLFADKTEMTIIPERFYINDKKVEGTIKLKNKGFNEDSLFVITQQVLDGKICLNSSSFFTWGSEEKFELDFVNRVMLLDKTVEALDRNGRAYSITTSEQLMSDFDCPYIQSGELKMNTSWGAVERLSFGTGECDNEALLKKEGESVSLQLDED